MATKLDLSGLRVLVLEDSWPMAQMLANILRGFGIRKIDFVADVEEALVKVEAEDTDFAIVDLVLRMDDGLRFVKCIRQRGSRCPRLPIVILSSHTSTDQVMQAALAGANDVLHKPVSTRTLYHHIASLVLNPRPFVWVGNSCLPLPRGMSLEEAKSLSLAEMRKAIRQPFEVLRSKRMPRAEDDPAPAGGSAPVDATILI